MQTNKPGYVLIIHKCRDFSEWKKGYAMDAADRAAATLTQLQLLQSDADAKEVVILFKYTDPAKVKAFVESPTLKAHMEYCGVIGKPQVLFLHDAP